MRLIATGVCVVLGSLFVTSCRWLPIGESFCAAAPLFSLSSNIDIVTTPQTITLKASVCTQAPASPVDFYDENTKVGTLASSSNNPELFDVLLPLSITKSQNGSRVYTAKITVRGMAYTTNPVTVTVNIP
jgi:hypothetical protein